MTKVCAGAIGISHRDPAGVGRRRPAGTGESGLAAPTRASEAWPAVTGLVGPIPRREPPPPVS